MEGIDSRTLPVRMNGNISLFRIHQIRATGLTPIQIGGGHRGEIKKIL